MPHVIHDFTYDGTFEGLLSVYIKCIAMKVRPLDIRPDFMVNGKPYEERYLFVRTNAPQALPVYRTVCICRDPADDDRLLSDESAADGDRLI